MLAPFVGLSHFVWTAQIAVTLVALACGYYAGGRLADRSQNLGWLYWAILGAASYLVLTVMNCEPVAFWALDFNLAVGSLLASATLFFIPLSLLAMTGPFLVRVVTFSVAGVGGNVGRLTSIGALAVLRARCASATSCCHCCQIPFPCISRRQVLAFVSASYFAFFNHRSSTLPVVAAAFILGLAGWPAGRRRNGYARFRQAFPWKFVLRPHSSA